MSNDLISRSELKKEINSLYMSIVGVRAGKGVLLKFMEEYKKFVLKCIDDTPTAYDLDAVCEEIADYRELVPAWALREIIQIVRNGGKKE